MKLTFYLAEVAALNEAPWHHSVELAALVVQLLGRCLGSRITDAKLLEVVAGLGTVVLEQFDEDLVGLLGVSDFDGEIYHRAALCAVIHFSDFVGSLFFVEQQVGFVDVLELLQGPLEEVVCAPDVDVVIQVHNQVVLVLEECTFLFSLQLTDVVSPGVGVKDVDVERLDLVWEHLSQLASANPDLDQLIGHNA